MNSLFRIVVCIPLLFFSFVLYASTYKEGGMDSLLNRLRKLNFEYLQVTEAEHVTTGSYTPKGSRDSFTGLPPFYRVAATLQPEQASFIKIEIWLPATTWNERLLGTGNGGGAGSIIYRSLADGIRKGYATANTDLGTSRGGVYGAVDNPAVWKDFGYRATHLMTVVSKAIIKAVYGKEAHHSYFTGCSTGGQQALMEAQRFPEDYDGIIAGAPANNRTHLHTGFLYNYLLTSKNGHPLFTKQELDFITKKITAAYATKTGGVAGDNFLTDPGLVNIDLDNLFQCGHNTPDSNCISEAKIDVLKKLYAGPRNTRTLEQIYTPPPPGSENVNGGLNIQQTEQGIRSLLYIFNWAFGNDFKPEQFDFDRDVDSLDALLAPLLNANDPDLTRFKQKGGRLMMYTGTADPLVPYQDALHYYERVVAHQKSLHRTQDFFRYYLIPGMGHCNGGPGLNGFSTDILTELTHWVETGRSPDSLQAKGINCCSVINAPSGFQRPVFPYPGFPEYIGGDPLKTQNYKASEHKKANIITPAKRYTKI